jgi:hypothetical protein
MDKAMKLRLFRALHPALLLALSAHVSACAGSAKASAKAKAGGDADANAEVNFDVDGANAWDMGPTAEGQSAAGGRSKAGNKPPALLGARHDLLLEEGIAAKCQCLAVILGQPDTAGMVWSGDPPTTNAQTQLVIALGSEGVSCDQKGRGASYMGYEKKGADVIVSVEEAVEGRPITHGAIIPQPAQGGSVKIRPVGKIPYGRGFAGESACVVTAP